LVPTVGEAILDYLKQDRNAFHNAVLAEILEERVVSSRGRKIPRGVKRKVSHFAVRARGASASGPVDYATHIKILK